MKKFFHAHTVKNSALALAILATMACGKSSRNNNNNSNNQNPPLFPNQNSNPSSQWGLPQQGNPQNPNQPQGQNNNQGQPVSPPTPNSNASIPVTQSSTPLANPSSQTLQVIPVIPTAQKTETTQVSATHGTAYTSREYSHSETTYRNRQSSSSSLAVLPGPIVQKTTYTRSGVYQSTGYPSTIPGTGLTVSSTTPLIVNVVRPPEVAKNPTEAYSELLNSKSHRVEVCKWLKNTNLKDFNTISEDSAKTTIGALVELQRVCLSISVKVPSGGKDPAARGVIIRDAKITLEKELATYAELVKTDNPTGLDYSVKFLHSIPRTIDFKDGVIQNHYKVTEKAKILADQKLPAMNSGLPVLTIARLADLIAHVAGVTPNEDCTISNIYECVGHEPFTISVSKSDPNVILLERTKRERFKTVNHNETSTEINFLGIYERLVKVPVPVVTKEADTKAVTAPAEATAGPKLDKANPRKNAAKKKPVKPKQGKVSSRQGRTANQTKPNQTKPNQTKPNQTKPR